MTAFLADEYKDYDNPFYDETKEEKLDVDNLIFENTKKCHNKSRVAYDNGLDLYAMIAQSAYNNDYWDNMEHYKPGTEIEIDGKKVVCGKKTHINVQGKTRRKTGKVLNLASTYGMGSAAAGEKLGFEGQDAAEKGGELLNNFFRGFPAVYVAIEESKKGLKQNEYVTGLLGRRRHLPWVSAPNYEVKLLEQETVFNPILGCNKPKAASTAIVFWNKMINFYIILSNIYQASKTNHWEFDGEMSKDSFDMLSRLAANPSLLNKPYMTLDQIAQLKLLKRRESDIAKFAKHTTTIVLTNEVENTEKANIKRINDGKKPVVCRESTAVGFDQTIVRRAVKDEHKNYITITWKEKILSDIDEYLNCYLKYNNLPDWATNITIDKDIVFPKEPVILQANTGRKAQALRQCFNARIQGSAATLTKLAMIDIAQDKQMNDMHAKLIIPVHDELLMECPAFYVDQVEKRLPELMCGAAIRANDPIPQACDPDVCDRWYANEMAAHLLDDYTLLVNGNPKKNIKPIPPAEALAKIIEENSEFPEEAIRHSIETGEELVFD